jgi:AhpD family alkylhydroperoxidase
MARLSYPTIAPEGLKHIRALGEYLEKSELGESLLNLVYMRVSQINGCPYCLDLHWRDLRKLGEDEQKLNGLILWRDMPFFSERERAALAWAEAATLLRDQHVSDAEYENARQHFTDKELVDLTLAIAHMNSLNRIAISFHVTPAARKPANPSHS